MKQSAPISYRPSPKGVSASEIAKIAKKLGISRHKFIDEAVLEKIDSRYIEVHKLQRKLRATYKSKPSKRTRKK